MIKKQLLILLIFPLLYGNPTNGTITNGTIPNGTIINGTIENGTTINGPIINKTFLNESISTLYKSIPERSISKHLAFYKLYPNTNEGKSALKEALKLLCLEKTVLVEDLDLLDFDILTLIQLINNPSSFDPSSIKEKSLLAIEKISKNLKNRSLKTHLSWKEQDFIDANPEDIDLARGLFLAEMGESKESQLKIRYYEAAIDLMALQILATLDKNCTDLDKIQAINQFIFFDMGFRFPPLSNYSSKIDTFTLLPSVIDNRKGVCLGLSILYLCLAQRLDLKLEAVTPPGHVFVRHVGEKITNIETTARGIDIPSNEYLNIDVMNLQKRDLKEVIGLAFINQASVHLKEKSFEKAVGQYEKAKKYLPNDSFLKELLGCSYLFIDRESDGKSLLLEIQNENSIYQISKDNLAKDYLSAIVGIDGLKSIFIPYEETREDILEKQEELKKIIQKYPNFRSAILLYANTYIQLGRSKESMKILLDFHRKNPDPIIAFYLSNLAFERFDFVNAWRFFLDAEKRFQKYDYYPKALKEFKEELTAACLN